MAVTLCAWHSSAAFDFALRSSAWHKVEHACFFGASLLFWWPVVHPFPSRPQWPLWSVPVYLLTADLLNTAISAILTFSDHVIYPKYLEAPRLFGTTALSDQSCAGVIMWVPGSLCLSYSSRCSSRFSASPRLIQCVASAKRRPLNLQNRVRAGEILFRRSMLAFAIQSACVRRPFRQPLRFRRPSKAKPADLNQHFD